MSENIKVFVRIRPKTIEQQYEQNVIDCHKKKVIVKGKHLKYIRFDKTFNNQSNQQEIYDNVCLPLIEKLFKGQDSTILVMGQKNSGKTYTLIGKDSYSFSSDNKGLITRAFDHISKIVRAQIDNLFIIKASCIGLCKNDMTDLLSSQTRQLKMKENLDKQVQVQELQIKTVENLEQLEAYLDYATRKKPRRNMEGHFIFTIYVESKNKQGLFRKSQINFVEYADTLYDNSNIQLLDQTKFNSISDNLPKNFSLSSMALKNVIYSIVDGQNMLKIPYSDSKFTWFLKKSFNGDIRTIILATISPCQKDYQASIGYLELAKICQKIQNYPKMKPMSTETDLKQYLNRIEANQKQLFTKSIAESKDLQNKQKQDFLPKMDTIYQNQFITQNHHRIAQHSSPKHQKQIKILKKIKNEHFKVQQNTAIMKKRIFNYQYIENKEIIQQQQLIQKKKLRNQFLQKYEELKNDEYDNNISQNGTMNSFYVRQGNQKQLKIKYKQILLENQALKQNFQKQRTQYIDHIRKIEKQLDFYKKVCQRGIGSQLLKVIQKNSQYDKYSRTYQIPKFVIKNKQINIKPFQLSNSLKNIHEIKLPKKQKILQPRYQQVIDEYHTDQLSGSAKGRIKPEQRSFFSPYLTRRSHKSGQKNSMQSGDRGSVQDDQYFLKSGKRKLKKKQKSIRSMHGSHSQKFL